MLERKVTKPLVLGLCLFVSSATSVFGAANTTGLVDFVVRGVGTGAIAAGACKNPAIACEPAHTCECFTAAETILGRRGNANVFHNGSLTFALSIDETSSPLPISTQGNCLPAGGGGTIMSSNGKESVSLLISGLVCPSIDGTAVMLRATYSVTTGTKFTHGTGSFGGALVGTDARIEVNGNLQP